MDVLSSSGDRRRLQGRAARRRDAPEVPADAHDGRRQHHAGKGVRHRRRRRRTQAIATCKRLGAVVSAFDVRPAVREQVQSLGATFVAAELAAPGSETAGGYAREQSADEHARTRSAIANHIKDVDLVIATAQIPGKPAPRLITEQMVRTMRAGSVIVDVAAETGGNCELSKPGETVVAHDVTIVAPLNLPATVPYHASQMFGRNIYELLKPHVKEGKFVLNPNDEILGKMILK